jgi:hypothetical protein
MIESKQVANNFETELKALLKKYDTDLEVLCYEGASDRIEVYIPSVWLNDECISESVIIDLGNYYSGGKK